ncbi:MAG: DUF1273 family protein [Clostridia bacterium]|nr:DUF1273 family protein [Clostridia bacterium]
MPKDFDGEEIKKAVYNAVNEGFSTFLVGMAIGFDALCFKVLEKIRQEKDIKIVACVPCRDQSKYFNKSQKAEYDREIASSNEVIYLAESYFDGCMQIRNEFMVDNSSMLICFLLSPYGGTYSTIKYAAEKGLKIVYLGK